MLQSNRNNAGTRVGYTTQVHIYPSTRTVVYDIRPSATSTTASLLVQRRKLLPTDTGPGVVRQNDGQSSPRVILHPMTALAGKHAGDDQLRHVTISAVCMEPRFLHFAADPTWAPGYCTRPFLTRNTCRPQKKTCPCHYSFEQRHKKLV